MTVRKHLPLIGVLVVFGLFALLLLMPLGFAAKAMGISARHSQGTIMSGALRDASVGSVRIGDVNARLSILPLFAGKIGFALQRGVAPYAPGISGSVGKGFGGIYADDLTATVDGKGLMKGLDGGQLHFETFSFAFSGGKCANASGVVRLSLDESALDAVVPGGMIGNAECRKGDLVLPLMSQSTMERALVRIKADGSYQLTLSILEPAPAMAAALGLSGFQPVAGGFRLVRSGRLN